jgi:hypothetical protein
VTATAEVADAVAKIFGRGILPVEGSKAAKLSDSMGAGSVEMADLVELPPTPEPQASKKPRDKVRRDER